jgi:hypothetical protein
MSFIVKLNKIIDEGLLSQVFIHIRNYLMCMTIMIAGLFAVESEYKALPGLMPDVFFGFLVFSLGIILALLNLYEAVYRLSKLRHPIILNSLLIILYVIVTFRIFEIVWHFSSSN